MTPWLCECGFDLTLLSTTLSLSPEGSHGESADAHCPVCRGTIEIPLTKLRVFRGELVDDHGHSHRAFIRWRPAGETPTQNTSDLTHRTENALSIEFKDCRTYGYDDICYPAIPVFENREGLPERYCLPLLPVRREFLDFLDLDFIEQEGTRDLMRPVPFGRARYKYKLALKGRERSDLLDIDRPIVSADTAGPRNSANAQALSGLDICYWPPLDYKEWKRFFLCVAGNTHSAAECVRSERLRAFYRERGSRAWKPLTTKTANGSSIVACTDDRPEWIALEVWRDVQGEQSLQGGGLFRVPTATRNYSRGSGSELALAVDFGSSSTVVGAKKPIGNKLSAGTVRVAPVEPAGAPRAGYIVDAGPSPSVHLAPDTWIPRAGFGGDGDMYPSELLCRQSLPELGARLQNVRTWKPVEDFSIPSAGSDIRYAEKDYVLSDFKWERAPQLPRSDDLQRLYLSFVLLHSLARVSQEMGAQDLPDTVQVAWAYPLVFKDARLKAMSQTWESVCDDVRQMTGLKTLQAAKMNEALDESRAVASEPSAAHLQVFVDVGGETTDVAILAAPRPKGTMTPKAQPLVVTSVRYAGSALLRALTGSSKSRSCLATGVDLEQLRRGIREARSADDLMNRQDLIRTQLRQTANVRAAFFYGYLVEYIARLVVASLVSAESLLPEEASINDILLRDEALWSDRLQIDLVLSGNGWGFGNMLDRDPNRLFTKRIEERARGLLDTEGRCREPLPALNRTLQGLALNIKYVDPPEDVHHPKQAVALGLLKHFGGGTERSERRKIVGVTTRVAAGRVIPWYAAVSGNNEPKGQAPVSLNATFDWREVNQPAFTEGRSPEDLDPGLQRTRTKLDKEVRPPTEICRWLNDSPLEVLMEHLFSAAIAEQG